jgi:hypothetical protein
MKKLTATFQRISGFISIAVFALMVVYALGMATPAAVCRNYQDTINFYDAIMPYNNGILLFGIFGLLISAFYFVLKNNTRIIYYISNFVWQGINAVYTIVSSIFTFVGVAFYQAEYSKLPFETMNEYWSTRSSTTINPTPIVFALGFILAVVLLLSLVPHILVLVEKIQHRIRYENNKKNGIENPVTYDPKEAK